MLNWVGLACYGVGFVRLTIQKGNYNSTRTKPNGQPGEKLQTELNPKAERVNPNPDFPARDQLWFVGWVRNFNPCTNLNTISKPCAYKLSLNH